MDLYFYFFLKPFSFVCILCTLLLRGWGAGKGGVNHALWSRVAAWGRVEALTFEWMFLGEDGRRITGGGG